MYKKLCCRGVKELRTQDHVFHFLTSVSSSQIIPLITEKRETLWECGQVGPRASSLLSQVSLLMMTCYPGKKLEHHLLCHLVFSPCFSSKSLFILLGRRFSNHLMLLLERFLTWMFGCQIQLTSVGPSLSQAAQCWICQAHLGD